MFNKPKYPSLVEALAAKKPGEQGTVMTDTGLVNYKAGKPDTSTAPIYNGYTPQKRAKVISGLAR